MGAFDQADDLQLLGGGVPHALSPPSPVMLFLSSRFSSTWFGKRLLEVAHLVAQVLDLTRRRLACGIARKPLLASLEELLRPAVIQTLGDPFPAAQLSDAVLAMQARQHDPDLLFGRILLARPAPDIPHRLISGLSRTHRFLSHLRSLRSRR